MQVNIPVPTTITDQNFEDLVTTAWYGAITYWATDPVSEEPEGAIISLHVMDDDDEPNDYHLTADDLAAAFVKILTKEVQIANWVHEYFKSAWDERTPDEGLEMGDIDAMAADVWVQVACFGKIVYG